MPLTTMETIGFVTALIEFLTNNQAALLAAGLNVSNYITELEAQRQDALTKNDQQETLKALLRAKTTEVETALATVYKTASTKLDATIGALGKTTELGKQAARLRSDIRRGSRSPPEEPTEE